MTKEQIILELKAMDVDGETMQHIIEEVGMKEQMHRQLIMSSPIFRTEEVLEERREIENMINTSPVKIFLI